MLRRVWSAITGRTSRGKKPRGKASYDAAQPGGENAEHWAWADSLNANAANSPEVRRTLRERARLEAENNGYCGGLIDKLANALVGACPRPQLTIPATWTDPDFGVEQTTPPNAARQVEQLFNDWARRTGLGQKLRLLDNAAVRDGEGFALFVTNPKLPADAVQLDLRLYETDQVATPWPNWADPLAFDGGRIDELGNVTEWHFLKVHPGSFVWTADYLAYETISAEQVVHWFKPRRAGQLRGVPEITSSLSLYAVLRRYTLATLGAAEIAASIAGVIETNLPAGTPPEAVDEMDEVDIPRRKLLTLPAGQSARPFDATQPTNTYKEFKGEVLTEAGVGMGSPRNVSTGSSAEYNFSSGRLDMGWFQDGIRTRRHDLNVAALDRIHAAWLKEASLIRDYLPAGLPPVETWSLAWRFPGFVSLDPQKDATTDDLRLRNGTTTYAEIYAQKGEDWEEAFEQQARENARRRELGLPLVADTPPPKPTPPEPTNADATQAAQAA